MNDRILRITAGLGVSSFVLGLLLARPARAATVENIQTQENGTIFNVCSNSNDTFTGVLHTIVNETFSSDGSVHASLHVDNHDVKLSDPVLGNCEGQETFDTALSTPPGETTSKTADASLRMECSGAGGNQDLTFAVQFTLASNGTITVGSPTIVAGECR